MKTLVIGLLSLTLLSSYASANENTQRKAFRAVAKCVEKEEISDEVLHSYYNLAEVGAITPEMADEISAEIVKNSKNCKYINDYLALIVKVISQTRESK